MDAAVPFNVLQLFPWSPDALDVSRVLSISTISTSHSLTQDNLKFIV